MKMEDGGAKPEFAIRNSQFLNGSTGKRNAVTVLLVQEFPPAR